MDVTNRAGNGLDVLLERLYLKWTYKDRVGFGPILDTFIAAAKEQSICFGFVKPYDVQGLNVDFFEKSMGGSCCAKLHYTKTNDSWFSLRVAKR